MGEEKINSAMEPQQDNVLSLSRETETSILISRENHVHEQTLDKQDKEFQLQIQERQFAHENSLKEKELGWMGKFFGSGDNSSRNIAAFVSVLLLLGASVVSVVIYACERDNVLISKIWGLVIPVLTLSLGYIFGKEN